MSEPKGVTLAGVEQHLRVVAGYLPHEYVRVEIDRASLYAGADLVRAADRVVAALRQIAELGHSTHHGKGYTLATLAEEILREFDRV